MSKLTAKQEKFCQEYLVDCSGKDAAIRAGYAKKAANVEGSRLLTHANVKAHIAELQKVVNEKINFTAADVIKEIGKLAFMNSQDLFDDLLGDVKPINELTRDQAACIQEISVTYNKTGEKTIKYKTHSKTQALDMLSKHFGVYAPVKSEVLVNDVSKTPFKLRTRKD